MSVPQRGDEHVAALLDDIRDRVRARREAGEYPDDLEAQLEAHFQVIVQQERADKLRQLERRIDDVDAARGFTRSRIETTSRVPGGGAFHSTMGRMVGRQTDGVLHQMQEFADAVVEAMTAQAKAIEDVRARVDACLERLTEADRLPDDVDRALADVVARLRALERGTGPVGGETDA